MAKFIDLNDYLEAESVKPNSGETETRRFIRADQIVEISFTSSKERTSSGLEYGKGGQTDGNVKATYTGLLVVILESGEEVVMRRWSVTDSAYKLKYARVHMTEEANKIREALIEDINS